MPIMHDERTKTWCIERLKAGFTCSQVSKDLEKYQGVKVSEMQIMRWRTRYNQENIDPIPQVVDRIPKKVKDWCISRLREGYSTAEVAKELKSQKLMPEGFKIDMQLIAYFRRQYNKKHPDQTLSTKRVSNIRFSQDIQEWCFKKMKQYKSYPKVVKALWMEKKTKISIETLSRWKRRYNEAHEDQIPIFSKKQKRG